MATSILAGPFTAGKVEKSEAYVLDERTREKIRSEATTPNKKMPKSMLLIVLKMRKRFVKLHGEVGI